MKSNEKTPMQTSPHWTRFIWFLLIGLLDDNEVTIKAKSEEKSWLWTLLVSFLPWLLLIGFFLYTSKKFQERAGGGLFGFGKSKAKVYTKATIDITYEDVAGLSNTKKELQEVVEFLRNPSKYMALGGQLPKGILLVGPPGTGKTLMARATASRRQRSWPAVWYANGV